MKDSCKSVDVFAFREEDELTEMAAKRFTAKFRNSHALDLDYSFLGHVTCGAEVQSKETDSKICGGVNAADINHNCDASGSFNPLETEDFADKKTPTLNHDLHNNFKSHEQAAVIKSNILEPGSGFPSVGCILSPGCTACLADQSNFAFPESSFNDEFVRLASDVDESKTSSDGHSTDNCFSRWDLGSMEKVRPMEEANKSTPLNEQITKEAPYLVAVLKEMKEGLDTVRNKIQALTAKVKADDFPTSDGISYLEAKHLLLLNYCLSLVYYLLRKTKGLSIQGHPVVQSLVEIRLFLEKIRPIDKKLQYQIQKVIRTSTTTLEKTSSVVKERDEAQKTEDLLKYRPNPDLLVSKTSTTFEDGTGVYRPPKFAPASMEEDKMSRQERNALRKEKEILRQAKQSAYVRELMNDLDGRPEEVRETIGTESREVTRYVSKMEERARQEEELFSRAPLTKFEKKKMKHLNKSRNGLLGLTESFYDEIKTLPVEGSTTEQSTSFNNPHIADRKFKKRKRKY